MEEEYKFKQYQFDSPFKPEEDTYEPKDFGGWDYYWMPFMVAFLIGAVALIITFK